MPFPALSAELASRVLAEAGLEFAASNLQVEGREERWLVRLPGQRIAWFAASTNGLRRLQIERRVMRLLDARCTFRVPRVQVEGADGDFDVREMVPGESDPWRVLEEVRGSPARAAELGTAIGSMLAEQHTCIGPADVADWLPRRPAWPEPRAWIRERLGHVVNDPGLIAKAMAVIDAYEGVFVLEPDRALVHADIGFHNLGIDPETGTVHGIFDYEQVAWADRHHDFRYLVYDIDRYELLDAAAAAYESVVGQRIRRERVLLYNAACAVSFLACRAGARPEERPCGRTLAEDLGWSRHAIARALGP